MRKVAYLAICLALIGVVAGFSTLGGSKARAGRPTLRVVRSIPLTVRGEHFRSREQVRLTTAAKAVTSATAHGDGVFVVTIGGGIRCGSVRVLARGSAGSYAVLKMLPPPMCQPVRAH